MKKFKNIWEAIQNGSFLIVDDITYRIDSFDLEQMSETAEGHCVNTQDDKTGEVQYWYFNEIESLIKHGESIRVQALCNIYFSSNK